MTEWKTYADALADGCRPKIDWLLNELNTLRTGRPSPTLFDGVTAESYGAQVPLKKIANIQVLDARTVVIKPFDRANVAGIANAINKANMGLNPIVDGDKVRIAIPAPTEESRKAMAKKVRELGEHVKGQCRQVRQDVHKKIKADASLNEDLHRDYEERINKAIKDVNSQVDGIVAAKEKEVMTV